MVLGALPRSTRRSLGRLGARLGRSRRRHTGTDIYVPAGALASSPIAGQVVAIQRRPSGDRVVIDGGDLLAVMAGLDELAIDVGDRLLAGSPVGRVGFVPDDPECNKLEATCQWPRLHLEAWARSESSPLPAARVNADERVPADSGLDWTQFRAINPVYAMKLGQVACPLDAAALGEAPPRGPLSTRAAMPLLSESFSQAVLRGS